VQVVIDYHPHKYQEQLHNDPHRYRVIVAGRRFGKSVFARREIINQALLYKPPKKKVSGIYKAPRWWIVSPTYKQSKLIHWIELKKEIPPQLVVKKNEVELEIQLLNGAIIELKGAENEDSLRGAGLMGVVMDEAAYQKSHIWDEILQPMILETNGWAVFIGTPKGYNWFYDLYQRGQPKSKHYDKEWASYRFTSYDNPYVPKKEIDKKEKQVSDDTFAQEYLAEFTTFETKIYKEFTPETHVIKPIPIPEDWMKYAGFDFSGGREPAAMVVVAIDPEGAWYVIKELYMKEKPSRVMIAEMRAELEGGQVNKLETVWCDPHMEQLRMDYSDNGFYMSPARKESATQTRGWVRHGIDLISGKLKIDPIDGSTNLKVFNTCDRLIKEFERYEWKEAPDESISEPGVPIKKFDHGLDAFRYFAVSYRREEKHPRLPKEQDWRIGIWK
jgi:hypothetical protein